MSCLSDSGYQNGEQIRADAVKRGSNIRQVGAIAIAIDNAARLIGNYRNQRDIADRSMSIAETNQRRTKNVYWPREMQFLKEFAESPEPIESVEDMGRRYGGRLAAMVADGFAKQIQKARCGFSRYCSSSNAKQIQDLMITQAKAVANARVLGRNIAFAEFQARHDTEFERRMQAVALGRGLTDQAASFLRAAGDGLASVGASLEGSLGSALEAFSYARRQGQLGTQGMGDAIPGASAQLAQTYARAPYPGDNLSQASTQGATLVSRYNINPTGFTNDAGPNAAMGITSPNPAIGSSLALSQANAFSTNQGMQLERWNQGRVGNWDLARTGSMTYDFTDSDGDRGSITVNMSDFPLKFVDHKQPGES